MADVFTTDTARSMSTAQLLEVSRQGGLRAAMALDELGRREPPPLSAEEYTRSPSGRIVRVR